MQTFEETSGYGRPERVSKWHNSMTDMMMMMMIKSLVCYITPDPLEDIQIVCYNTVYRYGEEQIRVLAVATINGPMK